MSWEHLAEGMRGMTRLYRTRRDDWQDLVIPPMLAAARETDPECTEQEMIDLLNGAADYPETFNWDMANMLFGQRGTEFFAAVANQAREYGA